METKKSATERLVDFLVEWIRDGDKAGLGVSQVVNLSALTGDDESTETFRDLCKLAEIEARNGTAPSLMQSHHQTLIDKTFQLTATTFNLGANWPEYIGVRNDLFSDVWAYLHGSKPYDWRDGTACPKIKPVPVVVVVEGGAVDGVYCDYGAGMHVTVVDMDAPCATREDVLPMTAVKTRIGKYSADLNDEVFEI